MAIGIITSLIVATLLLVIPILSLYARHFASRDLRLLSDVAKKYGGKISVDSFNTWATMDFPHRGTNVNIYQQKRLGGKATRTCMRCEVDYSTSLLMHIGKGISGDTSVGELKHLLLLPKIPAGSENFNKEFVVRGNNQSFLNALLAAEVEKHLISLGAKDPVLYMHPKNQVVARIKAIEGPNHLVEFSVNQAPRRSEELEKLIDDGLALIRRFIGARA